ncbi:MAG: ATP phosphoribosyltransferase regulatory subunit [Oscillospiraceae bacterium]|jgi:ATP phosphoribosyltransferase regulatory subunit|nr:ATP phosphoribosyltransferase regulatory subunit [Oscillospiraceae bacterium]
MTFDDSLLSYEEQTIFRLRRLYQSYGYVQYQMSKFEEYDLYAQNKDFLISDNVITFMDDGRLMALKPDVTLSIVRATRPGEQTLEKVFYDENVYRITKGSDVFREIRQIGLECIGAVDAYHIAEVLLLSAESLRAISEQAVLNLSHLGAVSKALALSEVGSEAREQILKCLSSKNLQGLVSVCDDVSARPEGAALLRMLLTADGSPEETLSALSRFEILAPEIQELRQILSVFREAGLDSMLHLDFSVISDMNYYSGVVFQGYVQGVPGAVLSGGRYDPLLTRMGYRGGAIGFAVYLDQLERLGGEEGNDVDLVLLCSRGTDPGDIIRTVRNLTSQGLRVRVAENPPESLRYGKLARLNGKEMEILEERS